MGKICANCGKRIHSSVVDGKWVDDSGSYNCPDGSKHR